ncbi:MAG: hypothetical protein OET44_08150 [Gammaproteobacteria bacterium]|nr:hypothetical protein [Gammaproteobacteria bacterium]
MSNDEPLLCWNCGGGLESIPVPVSRTAYCPGCRADLHVCRMCKEFDKKLADQCRAELEDVPHEKQRANFCDYFSPSPNAYVVDDDSQARAARAELDALFGVESGGAGQAPGESKADAARRELEALFGMDGEEKKTLTPDPSPRGRGEK